MPSNMPDLFSCIGSPPSSTVWGQTLQLPQAYAVLEVVLTSGDAREEGISILTRLSRMVSRSSLSRFEITNIMRQVGGSEIKSLVVIIPRGDFVTIAIRGSGQVLMRRGKTFATLLKHQGMITGQVKPGDTLLLLSAYATEAVSGQESSLFSEHLHPKEIAATLSFTFAESKTAGGIPVGLVVSIPASFEPEMVENKLPTITRSSVIPHYKLSTLKTVITSLRTDKQARAKAIAIVCVLFFVLSVALGIYRQQTDSRVRMVRQAVENAEKLLGEGSALVDVQPEEAKTVLLEAQNILAPHLGANLPKGRDGKKISELSLKIQDTVQLVLKIYNQEPQLFFDADFLQKGRAISHMTVGDDEVALVDATTGMVGIVSIPSKDGEIVTGGDDYKNSQSLFFIDQDIMVASKDSLIRLTAGEDTATKVLAADVPWDLVTTFSGNIYSVDKAAGDVWRYTAEGNTFAEKNAYFQIDINPDLTSVTNISIDGSIWMGSTIGKIFRYTQGRDDPFLLRGLDQGLGNVVQVWASQESDFVFVLDQDNHRVVMVNKSGVYKAQYVYPESYNPTQFGVSERNKKIFLLHQGKIFSISVE